MQEVKKLTIFIIIFFIPFFSCAKFPNQHILSLLPSETKSCQKKAKPEFYAKSQLYDYIDGGAEVFFKYGFDSLVRQEYCFEDNSIVLEIYKMASSKSAAGIYSYNRNPEFPPISIGTEGGDEGSRILFWEDKYYVIVQTFDSSPKVKPILLSLAKTVSAKISGIPK